MLETSLSLLDRLRSRGDDPAWQRLIDLYTPLLRGWLSRHALQSSDLDDLIQEILGIVVQRLPEFEHNRRTGAFRTWLRTITVHCLRRFWRAGRYQPVATGDSNFEEYLNQLEDPASGLSGQWDQEYDRRVLRRLLELLEPDFQPSTWQAFRRVVVDAQPAAAVAAELGMSVNAVLLAKSRVLRRMRQEVHGLLD